MNIKQEAMKFMARMLHIGSLPYMQFTAVIRVCTGGYRPRVK